MKVLTISILSVMVAVSQSATISWLTVFPLVLMSLNKPAEGFFGLFRRRQPAKPPVLQESNMPQMGFMQGFPQGGANFPFGGNPFGGNSFQRPPFFSGNLQGNFRPPQPGMQQWMSQNQGFQSQGQMPPRGQLSPLNQLPPVPENVNSAEEQEFGERQSSDMEGFDSDKVDDTPPPINTEEAESFFTLLAETDENKCISRLVCEMGAEPGSAGDLGQTVNDIIGSLTNFPPGSKVSEYNEVLREGRSKGMSFCLSQYTMCDEETYNLMKTNQPEG